MDVKQLESEPPQAKNMKKSHSKPVSSPPPVPPESMAALADGMADDFNNILTTVMGACSLIDRDDSANVELLQCVELIRVSAEHATLLSRRLMRAGTMGLENACFDSFPQNSAVIDTPVRDKKKRDGIVSGAKKPGGVLS